jgi:hypothetical protein
MKIGRIIREIKCFETGMQYIFLHLYLMSIPLPPMKFFTLVFSFYLLVVSLLPCSDARNECTDASQQFQVEQASAHNHQSDHNDVCSPFCTCTYCNVIAGFALQPLKAIDLKPVVKGTPQYPVHHTFFISAYFGNIWQPPRINA